jgi:aminopeptidase
MATVMTPDELRRYAEAVVDTSLRTRKGDVLAVHAEPGHRPYAEAITAAAYRAGARYVDVMYVDPAIRRARVVEARDESSLGWAPAWQKARMRELLKMDAAIVSITGEADPGLMKGVDPKRAVLETSSRVPGREVYLKAVARGEARFCVVAYPQPGWAKSVFPHLDEDRAMRALAKDLLSFTRLGPKDAPDAWAQHVALLTRRAAAITRRRFDMIEFRAPGTDLRVGLTHDTRFIAAEKADPRGRKYCANLPTEEVFASPDYRRTEGRFRCTRPLSLEGMLIEGIEAEFANGRLTRVRARSARHRDFLAAYFARDEGAGRLGEIALVDRSSRIGQSGRVFNMTLLDENAVAHVAFGSAYGMTRVPDPKAKGDRGLNASQIHVDVMIGSDELEVVGVTKTGRRVPVMEGGTWVMS